MDNAVKPLKVGMISLGCAKNLVDAEVMLGTLLKEGIEVTNQADDADVLIVNTCGFIENAKKESVDAILEANQLRQVKPNQGLIVSGCLSQRHPQELKEALPEVDALMGINEVEKVGDIVRKVAERRGIPMPETPAHVSTATPTQQSPATLSTSSADEKIFVTKRPTYIPDYNTPRFRLTPNHFAYVKIAEGCNHPCTFCIIPQMRGSHRSRTMESVVQEVRHLVKEGVKEFNLISQDTTYYGKDLLRKNADDPSRPSLVNLLKELNKIEGDFWLRCLYTHPYHWTDELIETIASLDKVVKYVDMPMQHIAHDMLERMRRETSQEYLWKLCERIRAGIPNIAIRTTFIVGFPGETESHFQTLLDFMRELKFERLGIFTYSQEDGTRAGKMEKQIAPKVKKHRYNRAMALQQEISSNVMERFAGKTLRVLVEKPGVGRAYLDAPDIDGRVRWKTGKTKAKPGEFINIKITGHASYDLDGRPV